MSEPPSALARFFGAAIMGVGVLITLLSGACTGTLLIGNLSSIGHGADLTSVLLILGVGLPFLAIGVALYFGGRAIWRGGRGL